MDDLIGPEEDAFLRVHSRAFLLGIRRDGSPTGWPMVAFYLGGALEFSTYGRSQKVRDFERNPRASCVIAPVDSDRALVLEGAVTVLVGQHEPTTGPTPPADAAVMLGSSGAAQGAMSSKRVVLRFTPLQSHFIAGFAADIGDRIGS